MDITLNGVAVTDHSTRLIHDEEADTFIVLNGVARDGGRRMLKQGDAGLFVLLNDVIRDMILGIGMNPHRDPTQAMLFDPIVAQGNIGGSIDQDATGATLQGQMLHHYLIRGNNADHIPDKVRIDHRGLSVRPLQRQWCQAVESQRKDFLGEAGGIPSRSDFQD